MGSSPGSPGFSPILRHVRNVSQIHTEAQPFTTRPTPKRVISASEFAGIEPVQINFLADESIRTGPTGASGIRTDTEISGGVGDRGQRDLRRWEPDEDGPEDVGTLEDLGQEKFDQFEVNARLYNYKSTYSDEVYTTPLDRNSAFYKTNSKMAGTLRLSSHLFSLPIHIVHAKDILLLIYSQTC